MQRLQLGILGLICSMLVGCSARSDIVNSVEVETSDSIIEENIEENTVKEKYAPNLVERCDGYKRVSKNRAVHSDNVAALYKIGGKYCYTVVSNDKPYGLVLWIDEDGKVSMETAEGNIITEILSFDIENVSEEEARIDVSIGECQNNVYLRGLKAWGIYDNTLGELDGLTYKESYGRADIYSDDVYGFYHDNSMNSRECDIVTFDRQDVVHFMGHFNGNNYNANSSNITINARHDKQSITIANKVSYAKGTYIYGDDYSWASVDFSSGIIKYAIGPVMPIQSIEYDFRRQKITIDEAYNTITIDVKLLASTLNY